MRKLCDGFVSRGECSKKKIKKHGKIRRYYAKLRDIVRYYASQNLPPPLQTAFLTEYFPLVGGDSACELGGGGVKPEREEGV